MGFNPVFFPAFVDDGAFDRFNRYRLLNQIERAAYECDNGNQVKKIGSFFLVKVSSNSTAPSQFDKIPP